MRFIAFLLLAIWGSIGYAQGAATRQDGATKQPAAVASEQELSPAVESAEALIAKQDWKAAEAGLAGWLAAHPNDARGLFDAGYVADAQNRTEDALAFYSRAAKADPKSFEARLSLGLLLARLNRFDEARPELEAATELTPPAPDPELTARAWRALAQLDRRSDPAKASDELMHALKLTPETPRDTLLAAELADASREPEAAEAAYKRVLAADPKNAEARAGLAHLLLAKREYSEAETVLRAALADRPGDPVLSAELAAALAAQNKAEALPLLKNLHAAHPDEPAITRMLAQVLAESGDAAGSDALVVQLLRTNSKDEELLASHGENLMHLQKYAEASQVFEKGTELDPADPDAWGGLAFAASKTGQYSTTLHALTMRSKLTTENPSTYFLWATSYDMLHDRVAAIKYYHNFLEAAAGKFPDQEWQARQRLQLLEKKP